MVNPASFLSAVRYDLPQDVSSRLKETLPVIKSHPYDNHLVHASEAGKILAQQFPKDIQNTIQDVSAHKIPALLIKDVPVSKASRLIDTPRQLSKRPHKGGYLSESILLGLAHILNSAPNVAKDNESGQIVREALSQIAPVDKKSDLGAGSKIAYKLHTEAAGATNPPDYFALLALRGDKNAKTVYMTTDQIVNNLDKDTIDALRQKEFRFNPKKGKGDFVGSVLRKNKHGVYEIRVNLAQNRTDALTKRAQNALKKLDDFVTTAKKPYIVLNQGDLAVFDNRRLLHGRDAFDISTPKGQERWLQRGYFGSLTEQFDVNMDAFLDKKGRTCHDILPRQKIYKNIQDFCKNATTQEKTQLLDKIVELSAGAKGYRFVMDTDPKTNNLRMYVATTANLHPSMIKDSRWEKTHKQFEGQPTTITNNPLYQKAQAGLSTTKDSSENFVTFSSLKPQHDLLVPKQKNLYRDLNEFAMGATDTEKTEFFDMIAKNIQPNGAFYVNCGVSRHIPWLHGHLVHGEKNLEKLATTSH